MTDQTVKVTVDSRNDGKYTVTVKLVGWSDAELHRLISALWLEPVSNRIARGIAGRLQPERRRRP